MVKRHITASISETPMNEKKLFELFERMYSQYTVEQIYLNQDQMEDQDIAEAVEIVRDKIRDLSESQKARTA
ncbi:MAG: hypothetical protein KH020_07975 [Clostridiales bacterium]|nr:hypothetical protein [Clostridiales bacterium]